MVNGWNYLSLIHGGLAGVFLSIMFLGEPNMFTFPVATLFILATIYCALQWHTNKLIARLEKKHGR